MWKATESNRKLIEVGIEPQLWHLFAWASYLTSLDLSFLMCKNGTIVSTLQDCGDD